MAPFTSTWTTRTASQNATEPTRTLPLNQRFRASPGASASTHDRREAGGSALDHLRRLHQPAGPGPLTGGWQWCRRAGRTRHPRSGRSRRGGGVASFAGAHVGVPDLMSLTRTLASTLGIIIDES
jgi:hypothetical protein